MQDGTDLLNPRFPHIVAVLPRSLLQGAANLTQLGLTRPRLDRRILLVWHPATRSTAARALLALARHHLAGPGTATR